MEKIPFTSHLGPGTLAGVLLIIVLCIADSYLTIDLVTRGGEELNPIMAFYLNRGPLLFFGVKYAITSAAIMIILSIKNNYIWRTSLRAGLFLVPVPFGLALVICWQLFLLCNIVD